MRIRRIQRRLPRLNIRLNGPHPPRPLPHLPDQEQRCENRNTHVCGNEIIQFKLFRGRRESVEAVEEGDEDEEDEGEVSGVGLKGGFEDQGVAGYPLGGEGAVELDVGD